MVDEHSSSSKAEDASSSSKAEDASSPIPKWQKPKSDIPQSMGLDSGAYAKLISVAAGIVDDMSGQYPTLNDSSRWSYIDEGVRLSIRAPFRAKVPATKYVQSHPMRDNILQCLSDDTIVDHFAHKGWTKARQRRLRKTAAGKDDV